MSARFRDTIKTRAQRLGEVLYGQHLKSGQADSQTIVWGCTLAPGTTNTQLALAAGEVVLGQAVVAIAASGAVVVDAGAATGVGEFRKVLVEVNAAGVVSQKVGVKAAAQADAVLPKGDADKISVGWIEVPASFVPGTTALTGGMLKPVLYSL